MYENTYDEKYCLLKFETQFFGHWFRCQYMGGLALLCKHTRNAFFILENYIFTLFCFGCMYLLIILFVQQKNVVSSFHFILTDWLLLIYFELKCIFFLFLIFFKENIIIVIKLLNLPHFSVSLYACFFYFLK